MKLAPRSLRAQLLTGLLVPLLIGVLVNTVSLYRQALRAADTAYDRTLLASAKSIGEKIVANTLANTEAAFEAAQAIARARTFPEIARLQANYWQQQFAVAGSQSKELFELSNKVTKQALETVGAATTKSFEQFKTAG